MYLLQLLALEREAAERERKKAAKAKKNEKAKSEKERLAAEKAAKEEAERAAREEEERKQAALNEERRWAAVRVTFTDCSAAQVLRWTPGGGRSEEAWGSPPQPTVNTA